MDEDRINPPPRPSTPKEAPWTDIENLTSRLDKLITLLEGVTPTAPQAPPDMTSVISKLDEILTTLQAAGGGVVMPELLPVTTRLDKIIDRLRYGHIDQVTPGLFPFTLIGTTSGIVLDENPLRTFALMINDSDTDIYLSLGVHAKVDQGIKLTPNGWFEIALDQAYTGTIYGICASADKRLLVVEAT